MYCWSFLFNNNFAGLLDFHLIVFGEVMFDVDIPLYHIIYIIHIYVRVCVLPFMGFHRPTQHILTKTKNKNRKEKQMSWNELTKMCLCVLLLHWLKVLVWYNVKKVHVLCNPGHLQGFKFYHKCLVIMSTQMR